MAVERADGEEVHSSPLAQALTQAGFRPTTRGLRLAGGPGGLAEGQRGQPGRAPNRGGPGPSGGPATPGGSTSSARFTPPGGTGTTPGRSGGGRGKPRGPDWRRLGSGESPPAPGGEDPPGPWQGPPGSPGPRTESGPHGPGRP
jgi:hypothetical protein